MPVNGKAKGTAVLEGDEERDHLGSMDEICQAPGEMKGASTDRTSRLSQPLPEVGN